MALRSGNLCYYPGAMKQDKDNQYVTRAMLHEDGYVTRAMLQEDEYVTKTILQDVLRDGEYVTRTMLDEVLDHRFEAMHRRIVEDLSSVMRDLMDRQIEVMQAMIRHHEEIYHAGESPRSTSELDTRLVRIETKLHKASDALAA